VCAVLVEREGAEPEQRLGFCVKLHSPVSEPEDSREAVRRLSSEFWKAHPETARAVGYGVMADRALLAWERNGVCVHPS
jgi:hypothetical protein